MRIWKCRLLLCTCTCSHLYLVVVYSSQFEARKPLLTEGHNNFSNLFSLPPMSREHPIITPYYNFKHYIFLYPILNCLRFCFEIYSILVYDIVYLKTSNDRGCKVSIQFVCHYHHQEVTLLSDSTIENKYAVHLKWWHCMVRATMYTFCWQW